MGKQSVYVLLGDSGGILKIFRASHEAYALSVEHPEKVGYVARKVAVEAIRDAVFHREMGEYGIMHCQDCGRIINEGTGHMHEVVLRSLGGEISVDNSIAICSKCHREFEHGDRVFQSSKIREKN
jgi:5-methylcytosine-specific restriction endonuclease McrA